MPGPYRRRCTGKAVAKSDKPKSVIGFNKALPCRRRQAGLVVAAALLIAIAGCTRNNGATAVGSEATLSIGFGESPEVGIQQTVRNIALEGLVRIDRDGRPIPWLAERWSVSPDGLMWRLQLRPGTTFHNGQAATASAVRDIVAKDLREYVGPAFEDLQEIRAAGTYQLEFLLKRRSSVLFDGLDLPIQSGEMEVGTGPFFVTQQAPEVEMRANPHYYGGKPRIDRITFRSYDSVRSAWADLLRGRVDMLYEVGIDAVDSLTQSTQTKVFPFQRPYLFLVLLNVQKPKLRSKTFRQALNSSINRAALVTEALSDHGTPSDGPVWPYHWTYTQDFPRFRFEHRRMDDGTGTLRFTCLLLADRSHERIGLTIQQQLRAVGVELAFQEMSSDQLLARLLAGDFEMLLVDARMGPSVLQQYLFWYSKGPNNWGHYSSPEVDAAFQMIRAAPDDSSYRAGVRAFQRAIVEDPPAIFLAWGERLRAVSTRFEVYSEPSRDILSTLRLWRPVAGPQTTSPN